MISCYTNEHVVDLEGFLALKHLCKYPTQKLFYVNHVSERFESIYIPPPQPSILLLLAGTLDALSFQNYVSTEQIKSKFIL